MQEVKNLDHSTQYSIPSNTYRIQTRHPGESWGPGILDSGFRRNDDEATPKLGSELLSVCFTGPFALFIDQDSLQHLTGSALWQLGPEFHQTRPLVSRHIVFAPLKNFLLVDTIGIVRPENDKALGLSPR